jgi:hypothetical protein
MSLKTVNTCMVVIGLVCDTVRISITVLGYIDVVVSKPGISIFLLLRKNDNKLC